MRTALQEEVDSLLAHYARRYRERVGKPPRRRDLDPVLARTLIGICDQATSTAVQVLDAWFDSPDPWYGAQGFAFDRCFSAINRLVGTGIVRPVGPPEYQQLVRKLSGHLIERHLRLVR